MRRDDRLQAILALLQDSDRLEVDDLASRFSVSQETIRRDLGTLSEQGLLRKVHGGAVRFQSAQEQSFTMRSYLYQQQKEAIAHAAAAIIEDGDSLLISSGTTTTSFARALIAANLHRLTAITNSAFVAHDLWHRGDSDHTIVLLGGTYNGEDGETNGAAVIEQIGSYYVDHAVVSTGTIDAEQGIMEYRIDAADVLRAMRRSSRELTVIADSSKLSRRALRHACFLGEIDRLITDAPPPPDLNEALMRAGVALIVAPPLAINV